jgi:hypothetical protein
MADTILPRNPAPVGNHVVDLSSQNTDVAGIINGLVPYIFVFAGLILLFMLIMGGLGLMTAAGNPDKIKAGQGKITAALIGFMIIFISYFVTQLVELMFGIKIF